ncbi:hypothetical protein AB0F72_08725 [Actinoplanes sp. NPDC023936]|uniref:hypothetical protein n=1 Tax=Actinoplanes sp. NPDC023936 TaxID=3154910 RepID=UPI0033D390CD
MREIHISPANLMAARNGETVIVRTADWESGIEVAFDADNGEFAPVDDGVARVILSPTDFQAVADNKGAGFEVKADNGTVYGVSVWA